METHSETLELKLLSRVVRNGKRLNEWNLEWHFCHWPNEFSENVKKKALEVIKPLFTRDVSEIELKYTIYLSFKSPTFFSDKKQIISERYESDVRIKYAK